MTWLIENWDTLLLALTSIISAASIITGLTHTPRDDEIVRKLYRIIEFLGFVTEKAKEK